MLKRVAAIYDIHGNLPALDAVLSEILADGVDEIVVGGDLVPGPLPAQTLDRLLELDMPVRFIRGNGENDVLAVHRGDEPSRVPQRFHGGLSWTARQLSNQQLKLFEDWPLIESLDLPTLGRVMFCHATPRDDNELFTSLTPEHRLRAVFEGVDASLVVCGHTHMQFDRTVADVRIVNAGSVGMPFGKPSACWLLLGDDVELRRTEYDLVGAARELEASGCPPSLLYDVSSPADEAEMLRLFESSSVGG